MIKQIYHQHKGRFGYRRITLTMKDKGIIRKLNNQVSKSIQARPGGKGVFRGV